MIAVFAIMLWKKVPAMIGAALDKQIAGIKEQLDAAAKLRADAEALKAEYEAKAKSAASDAEAMKAAAVPAGDGIVRVSRETKGRGGKTATVVKGVALDAAALTALGKQLKALCGSGGTVKDGVIEVQGDHCDRIVEALKKLGHQVKRAGG